MPKPATDSDAIFIVGSSNSVDTAMPADATKSGNARWNRRSILRSERRDHATMLTSPTTYGSAATTPAWAFDSPNDFTICGRKKLSP